MWLQVCASRMETGENCGTSSFWLMVSRQSQEIWPKVGLTDMVSKGVTDMGQHFIFPWILQRKLYKLVLSLKRHFRECSLSHRESQSPNCQPVVMQIESVDPTTKRSRYSVTIMLLKSKSHSNDKNYFLKVWGIHISPK